MSNEKIRELLAKLHDEIEHTDVDAETRALMQALESDIHQLIDSDTEKSDSGSIVETAQKLEADFAIQHPLAERVVREIVETLARMGV